MNKDILHLLVQYIDTKTLLKVQSVSHDLVSISREHVAFDHIRLEYHANSPKILISITEKSGKNWIVESFYGPCLLSFQCNNIEIVGAPNSISLERILLANSSSSNNFFNEEDDKNAQEEQAAMNLYLYQWWVDEESSSLAVNSLQHLALRIRRFHISAPNLRFTSLIDIIQELNNVEILELQLGNATFANVYEFLDLCRLASKCQRLKSIKIWDPYDFNSDDSNFAGSQRQKCLFDALTELCTNTSLKEIQLPLARLSDILSIIDSVASFLFSVPRLKSFETLTCNYVFWERIMIYYSNLSLELRQKYQQQLLRDQPFNMKLADYHDKTPCIRSLTAYLHFAMTVRITSTTYNFPPSTSILERTPFRGSHLICWYTPNNLDEKTRGAFVTFFPLSNLNTEILRTNLTHYHRGIRLGVFNNEI